MKRTESAGLARLCEDTDAALWEAHAASIGRSSIVGLRFPSKRPPDSVPLRVSEQEARHLFAALAPQHGYSYTLETPTELAYVQSGSTPTRARFDVSLLDGEGRRVWNVEFKHGGISARSTSTAVRKDIEKLLVDPGPGAWFHSLERIDNGTLGSLIGRLQVDVAHVAEAHRIDRSQRLQIHICVLQPAVSLHAAASVDEIIDGALSLDYSVSKGELTSIEPGRWRVGHPDPSPRVVEPVHDRWHRRVPLLWDIVSGRSSVEQWPVGPPRDLDEAIEWYAPISVLLTQSLGWVRPDIGLARWYDAGRPHLDRRFEMLDRIWGGHLDAYLAWAASPFAVDVWGRTQSSLGGHEAAAASVEWVDNEWVRAAAERQGEVGPAPVGGKNPLHLSDHLFIDADGGSQLLTGAENAVLLAGPRWYADLHDLDITRVEVISSQQGSLGEFSRSTTTDRWFSGDEEHHLLGWP